MGGINKIIQITKLAQGCGLKKAMLTQSTPFGCIVACRKNPDWF